MLINITPPVLFSASTLMDVENEYAKLVGNVVLDMDENVVYAVCPRDKKGCYRLIPIPLAETIWQEMIRESNK